MNDEIESLGKTIMARFNAAGTNQPKLSPEFARLLFAFLVTILDKIGGSSIVKVSEAVMLSLHAANRTCKFIIEGDTHPFGTGFLVGPDLVMTAAHLFFDEDGFAPKEEVIKNTRAVFQDVLLDGLVVLASSPVPVELYADPHWAVSPVIDHQTRKSKRSVDKLSELDYAIVKLKKSPGDESVGRGGATRGWFVIPNDANAPILRPGLMLRLFQNIDAGVQQSSIGAVKNLKPGKMRVRYTASTLDTASGSPVLDDQHHLAALHVAGGDEDDPDANNGIPIRRIVESLIEEKLGALIENYPLGDVTVAARR